MPEVDIERELNAIDDDDLDPNTPIARPSELWYIGQRRPLDTSEFIESRRGAGFPPYLERLSA